MPHSEVSSLRPGDHACALYSGDAGRAKLAAGFLAEGLTQGERCWYVGSSGEHAQIAAALRHRHRVDVASLMQGGGLQIIGSAEAYVSQGAFDPERTVQIFNDAIEHAVQDGYARFRPVADMTWLVSLREGPYVVIAYEAMLRSLFATSRATGLCLSDPTTLRCRWTSLTARWRRIRSASRRRLIRPLELEEHPESRESYPPCLAPRARPQGVSER